MGSRPGESAVAWGMRITGLGGTVLLAPALALGLALGAACGDEDPGTSVDGAPSAADAQPGSEADAAPVADAGETTFGLTSASIEPGGVIPTAFTCQGANISPALAWSNPPAGTQAFALIFIDVSGNTFLHSAMWDIPVERLELPEDVDKVFQPTDVPGAKQPNSYAGPRGYAGPCPGTTHTYEFRLHAVNAATLGGLDQQSTRAQVVTAIEAASLGSVTLSASFDPNNP